MWEGDKKGKGINLDRRRLRERKRARMDQSGFASFGLLLWHVT